MSKPLTAIQIDILRAGMTAPTPIGDRTEEAIDLKHRGLISLSGVRVIKAKTTGDGAVELSRARQAGTASAGSAGNSPGFKGITASDCNAWLASLPPLRLFGES